MSDIQLLAGHDALQTRERATFPARATPWFQDRRIAILSAMAIADTATVALSVTLLALLLGVVGQSHIALHAMAFCGPALFLVLMHTQVGLHEASRYNPVESLRLRVLAAQVFAAFTVATLGEDENWVQQVFAWVALFPIVVVVGLVLSALARHGLMRLDLWQTRIVLVGDMLRTRELASILETTAAHGFRILTRMSPEEARTGAVSQRGDLAVLVSSGDAGQDARVAASLDFPAVVIARDAGDMQTLWLQSRTLGGTIGVELRRSATTINRRIKRVIDVVGSTALLVVALPIVLSAAAAVWVHDWRNPFYRQLRVGLDGRGIRVWKIRSMFTDAEQRLKDHLASDPAANAEWKQSFKLRNDPRILPGIGTFIRRTSLDELPQLWNVLRGEMSLVGPRPFPAYHLAGFDGDFQNLRASVMPGLTGLWQITARSDSDLAIQKSTDTFYVRNWSLWFDLYILLHTLPAMVLGKGAR